MEKKLRKRLPKGRTFKQILNHYEVERAIATRLKRATTEERKTIYRTMYDELLTRVPDHPRFQTLNVEASAKIANQSKLKLVAKFLNKSITFVEFGPGDCRFTTSICDRVQFAYGVDISDQRKNVESVPVNFKLIVYNGYDLDISDEVADVVFSDQLIEHLHSDDIHDHFGSVRRILKPQGIYVFRTPHRFNGPHDVSGYFSNDAEGFHLREWTYSEIEEVLKNSEYALWWGYWCAKRICLKLPFKYFIAIERLLDRLPNGVRNVLSRLFLPSLNAVALK